MIDIRLTGELPGNRLARMIKLGDPSAPYMVDQAGIRESPQPTVPLFILPGPAELLQAGDGANSLRHGPPVPVRDIDLSIRHQRIGKAALGQPSIGQSLFNQAPGTFRRITCRASLQIPVLQEQTPKFKGMTRCTARRPKHRVARIAWIDLPALGVMLGQAPPMSGCNLGGEEIKDTPGSLQPKTLASGFIGRKHGLDAMHIRVHAAVG